ncbi:MAG: murein biosynthesis integral membrane protein MurJ, partial [Chloroflexi bacterium]|nr:murein biosynthesis integral membrane protein MurJ [Chloroflexota bacterium]
MKARIARAATIIALGNILSRVLGLVREQVIAALFGATAVTDAFTVAGNIHTVIYDLLVGGMLSAALVPVFSDYADDPAELGRVTSVIATVIGLMMTIVAVVLMAGAPLLVQLMGPGFDAATQALAVDLVRIVLPAVVFMGLSGVFMAVLYAREVFTYPAFAAAAFNGGIILGALVLTSGLGPMSLAVGVLLGALAQMVLQVPGLWTQRVQIRPALRGSLSHPAVRRILRLYAPIGAGLVVSQVGVVIDRNLASQTGAGGMAAMRFGTTLIQLPLGLVAAAVSLAVLPTLARYAAAADGLTRFKDALAVGIKLVILTILPATVGLIVLREPIVRLLFQHGAFDAAATQRTALVFLCYAPQLPFAALDMLLIFAFYARKNTLLPALVGVLTVEIYVIVALGLTNALGHDVTWLALANAVQNSAHGLIMFAFLVWILGDLGGRGIWGTTLKAVV